MKSRLLAGFVVVTMLTIGSLYGYAAHLRAELQARDNTIAAAILERDGFKAAAAAAPKEVIRLVPTLVTPPIVQAVKEKKIEPVAAGHLQADTTLHIPTQDLTPPDPHVGTPARKDTFDVNLTLTGNVLITRLTFGEPMAYKADLSGQATGKGYQETLDFPGDHVKFELRFNKEIEEHLAAYDKYAAQTWTQRHLKLQCPGVGLAYDPIRQQSGIAVTCSYGLVWF
jgi:hypothetical protein